MKYKNKDQVELLCNRIEDNKLSLDCIQKFLKVKWGGNCDGTGFAGQTPPKIYQLHVSEYSDKSGLHADLSGSMIQTEVLNFIVEQLQSQIDKDLELLETL